MDAKGELTRDAYLSRLGLGLEPPSVEALARIHRAHVEHVPYETLWIQLGEQWGAGASEAFDRIAHGRRGGYCFHLNGALGELLSSIGYDVTRHVGGVHGPDGPAEDEMTNHLVLTVAGLPSDENPAGIWYVDVGLGDAMHEPLPLVAGTYQQGPFRLVLKSSAGGVGDWHLAHDPSGSFAGMAWRSEPAAPDAFERRHAILSTSKDSGFVKYLTMQRRDAAGADVLRGLTLRRVSNDTPSSQVLASKAELVEVLRSLFEVDVDAIRPSKLDALWVKLHASHVAWEAAGRP